MKKVIEVIFPLLLLSGSFNSLVDTKTNIDSAPLAATETYCDEGDNEDPQPMLSGAVTDSAGGALYHACVEIRTSGGTLVAIIGTNSVGHYFFNSVSNGSYYLKVSYPGYSPKTTAITISGTPQTVNVSLN